MSSNETHRIGFETLPGAGHIPDTDSGAGAVASGMAALVPEPVDRALWLQLKLINLEAAELASKAGLTVILDRCIKMEHGRYAGRLHLAGVNTELISAHKARLP